MNLQDQRNMHSCFWLYKLFCLFFFTNAQDTFNTTDTSERPRISYISDLILFMT